MNVLSLFDGMSCGQIALNRAGIKYDNYFASEIDKPAIKVTMANYPNTIQLGDVTQVKGADLPKIDILLGGSPCQGFSFAGKQLNFEDPRSKLFFEYVRLLRECKPKYFLFENVKMKKEYENVISDFLGVNPIRINSSLVSAQKRDRFYWTNIPDVALPQDKNIQLQDILDSGYSEKPKSWCMLNSWNRFPLREDSVKKRYARSMMPVVFSSPDFDWNKGWRPLNRSEGERLQTVPEDYTRAVSEKDALGMLGNGWTVDVIVHIFKGIKEA